MAITKKGKAWEIKNSLWIIWSFIFLLNGIGIFLVGKKCKVKKWFNNGLIYTALAWISMIVGGETSGVLQDISLFFFCGIYLVCIIHSFKIRKEYLLRLEFLEDQNTEQIELDSLRNKIAEEYEASKKNILVHNDPISQKKNVTSKINNTKILNEKDLVPPLSRINSIRIKTPDVKTIKKSTNLTTLLDINSCNEVELAELPGIGIILAKKTINLRNSKNGFSSVDEFIKEVGIKPHFVERLRSMICCIPKDNVQTIKSSGRMVDF